MKHVCTAVKIWIWLWKYYE